MSLKEEILEHDIQPKFMTTHGIFWMTAWFSCNVGLTLMNKFIFKFWRFPFPLLLSSGHMFFTALLSHIYVSNFKIEKTKLDNNNTVMKLILFSTLSCANIAVGNMSVYLVNISLNQITRSTIPAITLVMSIFILKKSYSFDYLYSIVLLVSGVALASYGDTSLTSDGLFFNVLVCFLSALKSVTSSQILVGSLRVDPFELARVVSFLSFFQMILMSWAKGEINAFLADPIYRTPEYLAIFCINGFVAFLLNIANFNFTKATSALTVTVAGNVKHIVTILFGVLFYDSSLSNLAGLGTFLAVIGASLYARTEYKHKKT